MEAGPWHLRYSAQGIGAGQRNAVVNCTAPQNTGLSKRGRVSEPAELPVGVVVQAKFQRLTCKQGAAAQTRCSARGTRQRNGLAVLQGSNPEKLPTTDNLVSPAARLRQEAFASAEWKLVAPAQVEYVANIEAGQLVVLLDAES